eukprot:scpid113201/ scgid22493/ 
MVRNTSERQQAVEMHPGKQWVCVVIGVMGCDAATRALDIGVCDNVCQEHDYRTLGTLPKRAHDIIIVCMTSSSSRHAIITPYLVVHVQPNMPPPHTHTHTH